MSSSSDSTVTTPHDDCNNTDDPFSQSDLTQTISETFRLKDLCHVFSYVMCFRMYVMCFRMNGMCFRIMSCVFI
jgi:hypothetical protein